ncbi:hypothetical protein ElyMa_001575700 [Elysia marginata]|uniref:Uncharacterized protein n=1 Tax=Elysia marginata TaxID=1093978 RepID=A0AAV4JD87_9GAST|nr:hypothetical protein ElyMa_001575700 [Elysia marginata]
MYPTRPVAMEMDAIRERHRQGLELVRRHAELLQSIVLKQQNKPVKPEMDLAAMRERLARARREHAQLVLRRQQLPPVTPSKNSRPTRDSSRTNGQA